MADQALLQTGHLQHGHGRRWLITALLVGATVLTASCGGNGNGGAVFEEADRRAEVVDCRLNDRGTMEADIAVTNTSSEPSGFVVNVVFQTPDFYEIASGIAVVEELEPGETAEAVALSRTEALGEFECDIDVVTRIALDSMTGPPMAP